jgi:hypothetical protein
MVLDEPMGSPPVELLAHPSPNKSPEDSTPGEKGR